jgi:hypothetical protein
VRTRERVLARGAFVVPTFFVGEALFWGQDRMHAVARFARERRCRARTRLDRAKTPWAVARRWAAAWSRLDVEAVPERFADEAVFVSPVAMQVTAWSPALYRWLAISRRVGPKGDCASSDGFVGRRRRRTTPVIRRRPRRENGSSSGHLTFMTVNYHRFATQRSPEQGAQMYAV